jgi:hypothetical protein
MILESIMAILTGGGLGSITGLVGTVISHWSDASKRKSDLELARINHAQTLELVKQEQAHAMAMAQQTAVVQERIADIDAQARAIEQAGLDFRASHESDRATYSTPAAQESSRFVRWAMGFVDALRGIIRPGATIYALVLHTMLLMWLMDMISRSQITLTKDLTERLVLEIIFTTTFMVSTFGTWWFGIRGRSQSNTTKGAQ